MNPIAEFSSLLVLAVWLILPVALFVLAGLSGWLKSPLNLNHCWRIAGWLMLLSMAASVMVGMLLVIQSRVGGDSDTLAVLGGRLGLYPDGIAVWMALMVAFIGWVILRFASNYLSEDPGRERFLPWFLVTVASVLVLVFTNHLLILAGAWIGVSLALHHLLTLYRDRPQARMAAVQKFIVSRAGDVLVISGVVLLYLHYGTFYLPEMIQSGGTGGSLALSAASVALALAAILKCAQIPFHGWLIRVMEAPTPVSALLHAGVINLGGFLWLRLFPVFDGFTVGHLILLVIGGITAVVAVLTMMTQYSVKHALAWSTCAQMGFMLFEIGMGAYTLALLHLLAHSLYKAHSFLASGRTVKVSAAVGFPESPIASRLFWAGSTGLVAALILFQAPWIVEHNPVFGALLVLAVAAAAMGIPAGATPAVKLRLAGMAVLLVPVYSLLHTLVGPAVPLHEGFAVPPVGYALGAMMVVLLAACSLLISLGAHFRATRVLCVHFRQGLYLEMPFDQLTRQLAAESLRVPSMFRRIPHHPFRVEEGS